MSNPHVDGPAIIKTSLGSGQVTVTPTPGWSEEDTRFPQVIDSLGGQEAFEALPILDLATCTGGSSHTGYIDFVKRKDMSAPIMRGVDEAGRPFISLRISKSGDGVETAKVVVETIFRCYRTGSLWVSGGESVICLSAMTDVEFEFLGKLVRGEKVGRRGSQRIDESKVAIGDCRDDASWRAALRKTELCWGFELVPAATWGAYVRYQVGVLRLV